MAFTDEDLEELNEFLQTATKVVPYTDVVRGYAPPGSIAMRHDIDHSLSKAHAFAMWEHDRGYKSSYYVLTTAPYWTKYETHEEEFILLNSMIEMGHEVGFHNDCMNAPGVDGNPDKALGYLLQQRKYIHDHITPNYLMTGVADHGGAPHTNGELWEHYPPEAAGFEYEAYQLQKTANTYISDNQGTWRSPLVHAQTYMLVHPTWWPV
jgi:hypothetical protein